MYNIKEIICYFFNGFRTEFSYIFSIELTTFAHFVRDRASSRSIVCGKNNFYAIATWRKKDIHFCVYVRTRLLDNHWLKIRLTTLRQTFGTRQRFNLCNKIHCCKSSTIKSLTYLCQYYSFIDIIFYYLGHILSQLCIWYNHNFGLYCNGLRPCYTVNQNSNQYCNTLFHTL